MIVIIRINEEMNVDIPVDDQYFLTVATDGEDLWVGLIEFNDIFTTVNDDRHIENDEYEDFELFIRRKVNELVDKIKQIPIL